MVQFISSGKRKRRKGGWFNESKRHRLAAKGVKSGGKHVHLYESTWQGWVCAKCNKPKTKFYAEKKNKMSNWKNISVNPERLLFVKGNQYPRLAIRISKEDLYKDGKQWAIITGENKHNTTIEAYDIIARFKTKSQALKFAKTYMKR